MLSVIMSNVVMLSVVAPPNPIGRHLALLSNIRVAFKKSAPKKQSFMALSLGANEIKLFTPVIYEFS
jgi:hypothetical protein